MANNYYKFLNDFDDLQNPEELYFGYFQYYIANIQSISSNNILIKNLSDIATKYNHEYIVLSNISDLSQFLFNLNNNISYFKNKFIHFSLFDDDIRHGIESLKKITIQEELIRTSNLKLIFSCSNLYFNEIMNTDFFYYQTLTFTEENESLEIFNRYKELTDEIPLNASQIIDLKKSNFKI